MITSTRTRMARVGHRLLANATAVAVALAVTGCPGQSVASAQAGSATTTPSGEPHAAPDATDSPKERPVNRLAKEHSPYLLQHRHNPVDWYPWGEEAFAKAKAEDKPIFLSVGYSTCHWCHVMERESFENEEIAAFLNEHFVAIKVDREERPDVDAVYMAVTQAMTGRGGWPMSVFMTPERKPFFAGTYFPPDDRYGRPGFLTLLGRIQAAWIEKREAIEQSSEEITDLVKREGARGSGEAALDVETLKRGVDSYARTFDAAHGGFGGAPKFPRTHDLSYLMRWSVRDGDMDTLGMVTSTLDHMARGGIYDHLGGGFHRYATDREWLVPHFEKMLYDQALIARTYLEAYQVTGLDRYAAVTRDIFRYVLRDLQDPAGGLYSAEDADSEGVEGKFYLWTYDDLIAALGEKDGALFCRVYGATKAGNYHEEASGDATHENILHLPEPTGVLARSEGMSPVALELRLAPLREKLFAVREPRIHPFKDDKILTDWNGLMIAAFAVGARVLDDPAYADAARNAAAFCLGEMRTEDGRLLHRYRAGKAGIPAGQEDYAYLCLGLLELYETTYEVRWLAAAKELAHAMVKHFWDPDGGGFFLTADDAEQLIARTKALYDGARPSGNSVAMVVLIRLGRILADEALSKKGDDTLKAFSAQIASSPRGYSFAMQAVDFVVGPSREIVIAGDPANDATQALLTEVRKRFLPNVVVVLHPPGSAGEAIRALAPYVRDQGLVGGKPAAYVCTDYTCQAPVTSPDALGKLLDTRD